MGLKEVNIGQLLSGGPFSFIKLRIIYLFLSESGRLGLECRLFSRKM